MPHRPPPSSARMVFEHLGSITHFRRVPSARFYTCERDRSPQGHLLNTGRWVYADHDLYGHDAEEAFAYYDLGVSYIVFGYTEAHVAVKNDGSERRTAGYPLEDEDVFTCYIDPTVYQADTLSATQIELERSVSSGNMQVLRALEQTSTTLEWMAANDCELAVVPDCSPPATALTDRLRPLRDQDLTARTVYRSGKRLPVVYDPRV